MKCPVCGNEMVRGRVEARELGSLTQSMTTVSWYSAEECKKKFFRKPINLCISGIGYYCDECMKVYAEFDEK